MATSPRDPRPASTDEPRVLTRVESTDAHEPRLGLVASIVILASLVAFVVAGMAIPSSEAGTDRPIVAAVVAVAAFTVAVVTFALGALRTPRRR